MPPKVQIPREKILDAGLAIAIEQGPGALTIRSVAERLGCSTQPISWTFGGMEGFRDELAAHALAYLNAQMTPQGKNPVAAFANVGETYLRIAFDQPNLVRFIRENSPRLAERGGIGDVFDKRKMGDLRQVLSQMLGIDEAATNAFMETVVIYAQGLASFVVDGTIDISCAQACTMLREAGIAYMQYAGVPEEKARGFFA